jgi:ectoine hydroxylase-related dioxygenase (phytanoyl-CoA dioxygenase family)
VPLHCDSVVPDPFPPFEQVCNATWLLTDFDVENGGTLFMPGTNRLQRHPRDEESTDVTAAEPLIAPAGSVAIWGGNIWHGALPRTAPGLRVSLLTMFHRYYVRVPHMSFGGAIPPEMVDRNPERFAYLTGVTTNETREYLTRTSRFA